MMILLTDDTASDHLKKQSGSFSELISFMDLIMIKEIELLCQQVDIYLNLTKQRQFMQINHL